MNGVEMGQNRLQRALHAARNGHWPDSARVKGFSVLFLIAWVPMLAKVFFEATGGAGSDFLAFWGAGRILAGGNPANVYNLLAEQAAQAASGTGQLVAYVNPPPYLFLVAPLGWLPYVVAWVAWGLAGWAAWFLVARRIAPGHALAILASPVAYLAASHGQNGFFTAALLVGGVLFLPRKPWLAGALFGALIIKPHLALLVPFWLLAGRQWRAIGGAAISAIGLCLLSLLVFGPETWAAYPQSFHVSRVLMAQSGGEFFVRMCTPYAAVHVLAGQAIAVVLQGFITLGGIAITCLAWRRSADAQATGAMMLAATALASPYLFSYDLAFLVQPVFWLATEARRTGWRPWEKQALILLWLAPLATRAAALPLGINLMPLAAAALLALVWTRLSRK
ncbi:glycosyltransferase family 87 protein [Novosphingobium cyanobacteriorum]|uniref:Glycosyltransferase family 87 protein n=1 Tax=Novosphingobium cyanobacteriorum TaxID=3024215 RepID=A0ABT6CE67_9SPHN|nr:glycosyltransferase family 87 protein [Novosphingobium cyanobacteriorum]MDF8332219.1 glycosyltransferase family 87 protein [Novosphingobium cyanobacteriorum]